MFIFVIADKMAEYIDDLNYSDLSKEVIHQAKRIILDTMGCMIGGYESEIGHRFIGVIRNFGGRGETTLIGDIEKRPWICSALGNSYLADLLDFEQTLTGHESATIVPAALSSAEKNKASGKQLITSVVAGYEIQSRIGLAIAPSKSRFKEIASPSIEINHAFGAVVAAGKLFDLSKEQMSTAITTAGILSPIPTTYKFLERPASWLKGKYWWCTFAGCFAILLTKGELHGPADLFGGEHGYWICAGSDRCDFDAFTKDLGNQYLILNDSFKPYPSCRWTHCALDVVSSIIGEKNLYDKDISAIRIKTSSVIKDFNLDDTEPLSMIDAQFSLPYCIAMIILRKKPGLDWYSEENLKSSEVLGLCKKVTIEVDEELNRSYFELKTERANPAYVEITTVNGEKYSRLVKNPRGSPENPMSDKELEKKFINLVSQRMGNRSRKLIGYIWNLEQIDDISVIMDIIRESYKLT